MVGKNQLVLCRAEMIRAVEFYLKAQVMKSQGFTVLSVSEDKSDYTFKVDIDGGNAACGNPTPGKP